MNEFHNKSTEKQEIYITDMSQCRPDEAISNARKKRHWQIIPYEAEGLGGVMLGANSVMEAPDVTLSLGVSGWHAIYLGFWNPHHAYDGGLKVKIKLTDDPCFQTITDPEPQIDWTRSMLKEAFIRYADLTGKNIIIGQQNKGNPQKAYVAYIKLVPLSHKEVQDIEKERARKDTRILYSFNDGHGLFYNGPTTREDLLEQVEQYRYSDVRALVFAAACGDTVNYPSKIGRPWFDTDDDGSVVTAERKQFHHSFTTLQKKGIVPMQVLAEHVHKMGIDFHASFRMSIQGDIPPGQFSGLNGLVRRRPDLRMVDKDGTPVEKASYAFPEVRQHMLSLIREVAEGYDVDGVNLCFIRGPQFVGYEDIVVEDFKKKYGIDPRTLDENDIRAQQHRAGYLTELIRETRRLSDEVGRKKKKKIELSVEIFNGEVACNLFFGLDVMTWLKEGFVDNIFASANIESTVLDAIRFHNCKLIYQLAYREDPTAKGAAEALQALQGFEIGVDGLWYWDMNSVQTVPGYWEVLRRIGHKEEARIFSKEIPQMKTTQLKRVGGYDICHLTCRGGEERGWGRAMLPLYSGG